MCRCKACDAPLPDDKTYQVFVEELDDVCPNKLEELCRTCWEISKEAFEFLDTTAEYRQKVCEDYFDKPLTHLEHPVSALGHDLAMGDCTIAMEEIYE